MTQEVLRRLQDQAVQQTQSLMEQLRHHLTFPPQQWADQQPAGAYLKGRCDRTVELVQLEYEDVLTEDELVALDEAEEKMKNGTGS